VDVRDVDVRDMAVRESPDRSRVIAGVAVLAALALAAGGCHGNPTPSPTPSTAGPQAHRIAVRQAGGGPEFFDTRTGQRFVPRGANFHRLSVEGGAVVDTLFAVGSYDPTWVDGQLAAMTALGYNAVRTAFDLCQHNCIGKAGGGLDSHFLDNIADFLGRARNHGLQVFFQSNDLPLDGGYVPKVEATASATFDGYMNSHYLSKTAFEVYRDYWVEIVQGLVDRHAALDAVAGFGIRGEAFLFADKPPVSLLSGQVTTANGKTYDLSNATARRAMLDEGLRFWVDSIRAAIRQIDPTALVGAGAFAPNDPNPWRPATDSRLVVMEPIWGSTLDFVDVHPYPGYIPLPDLAANFRLNPGNQGKPVIMGEYGAFTFAFPSPAVGAAGLMAWQVASCKYGIDGWFHWHWQGTDDHEVWTGTEGANVINRALSPMDRPDPCKSANLPYLENNIAKGRPVTVSAAIPGRPGSLAVDGSASTGWLSGGGPPGWIQVQLAGVSTVREVRLTVDQDPAGPTVHQVRFRINGQWQIVHTFSGQTKIGDVLTLALTPPAVSVTDVRIDTVTSPSWVAWYEIEVLGG
jgi:hypothetical protein